MNKFKFIVLSIILFYFYSCSYFEPKINDKEPIARVYNTFLHKGQLENFLMTNKIGKEDSVLMANNYINDWIKRQLLYSKAQLNLNNQTFEELVTKYSEDLYINAYKEAVVSEYLDTVITQKNINTFYNENKENFRLNEALLRLRFLSFSKSSSSKRSITKLFKSNNVDDLDSLRAMFKKIGSYHLNDSIWIKMSDVINELPYLKSIDKKAFLKRNHFFQKEDSLNVYLMMVKNHLKSNEIAPKNYVLPTIKSMILHKRKLTLMSEIEKTLLKDASKKEHYEIY